MSKVFQGQSNRSQPHAGLQKQALATNPPTPQKRDNRIKGQSKPKTGKPVSKSYPK